MPGPLGRKMKAAKKAGGKSGWTEAPVRNSKECPGCKQRYDKMPRAVFDRHVSAAIKGEGCPFPRK